jgi:DNA-binding protein YbaB
MAFDPIEHLAEARLRADRRSEHNEGRIVAMERTIDELRYRIEETERELAAERTTGTAGGGAVRVVVDGVGTVMNVELAEQWYGTASAEELGSAALAGLRDAAGASTGASTGPTPEPDPPAPIGVEPLDDLARRLHVLRQRLDAARVRAATAGGDVTVVCDGYGTAAEVVIRFSGPRRPTAALLGERIVAAARSAQEAAAKLRERTHQDARAEALQAAGIPLRTPDAASIVTTAFGLAR